LSCCGFQCFEEDLAGGRKCPHSGIEGIYFHLSNTCTAPVMGQALFQGANTFTTSSLRRRTGQANCTSGKIQGTAVCKVFCFLSIFLKNN
jgi:hypothetical protein